MYQAVVSYEGGKGVAVRLPERVVGHTHTHFRGAAALANVSAGAAFALRCGSCRPRHGSTALAPPRWHLTLLQLPVGIDHLPIAAMSSSSARD